MNKKIYFKVATVLLLVVFGLFAVNSSNAKIMKKTEKIKTEGHFEELNIEQLAQIDASLCLKEGIKLKDNRILFPSIQRIYNPVDNSLVIVPFPKDYHFEPGDGLVLKDGNVFFLSTLNIDPDEQFSKEFARLIYDDLEEEVKTTKNFQTILRLKPAVQRKFVEHKLKDHPDLLKRYNDYKKEYEDSAHGYIYNPETNTFNVTPGKAIIRRKAPQKVQLSNGNILMIGGRPQAGSDYFTNHSAIEIYNFKTGKFELIKTDKVFKYIKIFPLKNDQIFIQYYPKSYIYYDAKNNKFSESKKFNLRFAPIILQLKNDNFLLFSVGRTVQEGYYITRYIIDNAELFNPYTEELTHVCELAIPRGEWGDFYYVELQDGRILIYGGVEYPKHKRIKDAEILDLTTGISKVIGYTRNERYYENSILLDDGRAMLFGSTTEFYIPENYEKNK